MEHLTGGLDGFLKELSCSLNGRLVVERRGCGCWRLCPAFMAANRFLFVRATQPIFVKSDTDNTYSLFSCDTFSFRSTPIEGSKPPMQCCSKPEKRFDPLFIMLLTPVSGYNGIQHIWGGTISVTSNWRPEPGMYCCRHKLSALPSKQMVMMVNTLIKSRLSLDDCLIHLTA